MPTFTQRECRELGINPNHPNKKRWPAFHRFRRVPESDTQQGLAYTCGRYDCVVAEDSVDMPDGRMVAIKRIQICNWDQSAQHDWRDFQRIKDELAGEDWEAVELYPAACRLIDPSNAFYLWCFPGGALDWVGFVGRSILSPSQSIAPQRELD